jgi:hypothetical protein
VFATHIRLDGSAAVTADSTRDLDSGQDLVRVYLGEALTITLPLALADALGDALAAAHDAVQWPTGPWFDGPRR